MIKKKLDLDSLKNKDHYRGIIYLLKNYQEIEIENGKIKKVGLRQLHFRYALIKEPNIYNSDAVRNFFNKKMATLPNHEKKSFLEMLWEFGVVRRGCVKTPQHLNNYLEYLIDNKVVRPYGRRTPKRYALTDYYYEELDKEDIKKNVERWHYPEIVSNQQFYEYIENPNGFTPDNLVTSNVSGYSNIPKTTWYLCGLSPKIFNDLTKEEKEKLNQCLLNIEKNLWEIMELKQSKTRTIRERSIRKVLRENKKVPFPHRDRIGFYYNAKKLLATDNLQIIDLTSSTSECKKMRRSGYSTGGN